MTAINTVQKSYPLQPGDAILLTTLTYESVKIMTKVTTSVVPGK